MEIQQTLEDTKLTLRPLGRIDTLTAPSLAAAVKTDGLTELVFDLSDCDYISSAGLRVLVQARKAMPEGKVVVAHACPVVREVFDVVGFSDAFTFED